jgi:hypothetical protein
MMKALAMLSSRDECEGDALSLQKRKRTGVETVVRQVREKKTDGD